MRDIDERKTDHFYGNINSRFHEALLLLSGRFRCCDDFCFDSYESVMTSMQSHFVRAWLLSAALDM